nr:hypothetical protein [uncultured Mediterranean phage uvMED]
MLSTEILDKVKKIVSSDRAKQNGDMVENHENISRLWTSYLQNKTKLNINILPEDVANLMVLLKIARSQGGAFNIDDFVDMTGYSAIAGHITSKRHELSTTLGVSNDKKTKNK